jgi:hypothetical protein
MPEFTGRVRPPRLASSPATPASGEMYWDSTINRLMWWNGTNWVDAGTPIYSVSTMPASPVDGMEVYYAVDLTAGVLWHFRYRAGSGSAYKWEFLGGPPVISYVDTDQTTTSGTFADLATVQSITIPLAGEYDVEVSCGVYNVGAQAQQSFAAIRPGGAQIARVDATGITAYGMGPVIGRGRAAIGAAEAVKMQYATNTGTAHYFNRRMTIYPVRVQ